MQMAKRERLEGWTRCSVVSWPSEGSAKNSGISENNPVQGIQRAAQSPYWQPCTWTGYMGDMIPIERFGDQISGCAQSGAQPASAQEPSLHRWVLTVNGSEAVSMLAA